jgi:chemotaxis protein MotB
MERWLITYADLITLLLAFFIMMYTFSKQDAEKYQEVARDLKTIFHGGVGLLDKGHITGIAPIASPFPGSKNFSAQEIQTELTKILDSQNFDNNVVVLADERGVVIRMLDRAVFDEGRAGLKVDAMAAFDRMVPLLKQVDNPIRIEGHTDNVPIRTNEFNSNWELSVRRATEVIQYLIEQHHFPAQRLSAVGYAEYRPIVPNSTPENRALNRRIEIIVLTSR